MTAEITWVDECTTVLSALVIVYLMVSPTFSPSVPDMRGLISFVQAEPDCNVATLGMMFENPSPSGSHELNNHSVIIEDASSHTKSAGHVVGFDFSTCPLTIVFFGAITFEPHSFE